MSASEVIWRFIGAEIVYRSSAVLPLDARLGSHCTIYVGEEQGGQVLAAVEPGTNFEANEKHAAERHLHYVGFLQYFESIIGINFWPPSASLHIRQTDDDISRSGTQQCQYNFTRARAFMVTFSYSKSRREGENFYVQTLMVHVERAKSFCRTLKKN